MNGQPTNFTLDGRGPLYRQIKRAIAEPILSGRLAPGTRLPSEDSYTRIFETSRMTVNRALQMLADDGLITRHRRNGTFVAAQVVEHAVMELRDIAAEIESAGGIYTYQLLQRNQINAEQTVAEHLGLQTGAQVLYLQCRHLSDGVPFVIEDRYININSVPQAVTEPFDQIPPSRWLLKNVPWTRAEHAVSAINAPTAIGDLLGLIENEACLRIERTTWLSDRPVTYVHLTYPGTRHRLVGRFSPGQ
jgi:GntR family transcriptional regulator, histidine utilization repressor